MFTGQTGLCTQVTGLQVSDVLAGPLPATGGSCVPSGGGVSSLPAPSFAMPVTLCTPAATGSGCSAGACLPKAPSGFGASRCIYQAGALACPVGYPAKTTIYTDFTEGRTCTACACETPTGGSCNGQLRVYRYENPLGTGCVLAPLTTIAADGSCVTIPSEQVGGFILDPNGTADGGACPSSGGQPSGSASVAKPITVCCE